MFIVLLANIINTSKHAECVSLGNQKCKIEAIFLNLHPNEYSNFTPIHLQLN